MDSTFHPDSISRATYVAAHLNVAVFVSRPTENTHSFESVSIDLISPFLLRNINRTAYLR